MPTAVYACREAAQPAGGCCLGARQQGCRAADFKLSQSPDYVGLFGIEVGGRSELAALVGANRECELRMHTLQRSMLLEGQYMRCGIDGPRQLVA